MRLSEAMRLGAMMKPQGTVCLEHAGRTCALGAALDAIGQGDDPYGYDRADAAWPELNTVAVCPVSSLRQELWYLIVMLNDDHHWTREAIADWVETIERAEETGGNQTATEVSVSTVGALAQK